MRVVWLETSALIGLVFCGDRDAARRSAVPEGVEWKVSRYVLFELGRGYLSYFIKLHNEALTSRSLADLHRSAYSGQRRYRTSERSAWLEAFTEYLQQMDGTRHATWGLTEMREQVWTKIRRGWRKSLHHYQKEGGCPCRGDLPPPTRAEWDNPVLHPLPTKDCGKTGTCGLLEYLQRHAKDFEAMACAEEAVTSADAKLRERARRVSALRTLMAPAGNTFAKSKCYSSADAIIAHEARLDRLMTRDGDYQTLCGVLRSETEPFPQRFQDAPAD